MCIRDRDIVLGLYYMTRDRSFVKGEYREARKGESPAGIFSSPEEVRMAYDHGGLDLQARIKVRMVNPDGTTPGKRKLVDTTCGRVLLSDVLPAALPFKLVNRTMGKKQLGELIDTCYRICDQKETVLIAEDVYKRQALARRCRTR